MKGNIKILVMSTPHAVFHAEEKEDVTGKRWC
jgi:hypothetical protein